MAEQKDKKGRSIHHTQVGQKGGKIGEKKQCHLKDMMRTGNLFEPERWQPILGKKGGTKGRKRTVDSSYADGKKRWENWWVKKEG